MTIHVRDLLDFQRFRIGSAIVAAVIKRKADRIIAIDNLSAQPFLDSGKVTVLTNPFDMGSVYALRRNRDVIFAKHGLEPGLKYVAMLGQISELKGAATFLQLAKATHGRCDIHFLLVGADTTEYSHGIIEQARTITNLTYMGEMLEVEEIYALADVVVRCDSFLPLGRTLWEAYFSGCKVLAPTRDSDDPSEIAHLIGKAIWLYTAGEVADMRHVLEEIAGTELQPPPTTGNHREYAAAFYEIVCGADAGA